MWWFEGFEAWRRTKFETKLDINEKISQILGGQGIGSRIQVIALLKFAFIGIAAFRYTFSMSKTIYTSASIFIPGI